MTQIRIGMVNYINTAPIYEVWKENVANPDWKVTEAPPSVLNTLLRENRIDLGMVSSYEYAARPEQYRILEDLSISATGPVGSVFLFSRIKLEELDNKLVLLTRQSETSVALVKIVLEEFYGLKPRYRVGDIFDPQSCDDEVNAILAIGDDALSLKEEQRYPFQLDLADEWNKKTGLPFVFAVFAVREELVSARPEALTEIWKTLLFCRDQGKNRLEDICRQVAPRIPMDVQSCYRYLRQINHGLDSNHVQALNTFFQYLIRRGEAPGNALPLKFFPGNGKREPME